MWFTEKAQPTDLQLTLLWAGIVGFCGAICSIGFRLATGAVHKLLTGSPAPHLSESFAHLPLWMRLIVPGVGGLIAGAILQFRNALARSAHDHRLHGSGCAWRWKDLDPTQSGEMSFCVVLDRFRWLDWPRRSPGSTFIAGCLDCRTIAKMVAPTIAIARRLWRSRRYRISLQRTNCRRGLCRRDRLSVLWRWKFSGRSFFHRS